MSGSCLRPVLASTGQSCLLGCVASSPSSCLIPSHEMFAAHGPNSPTTNLYVVEGDKGSSGSGGLSAGAIAGIAVGSLAAVSAAGGLAWWWQRRRPRQHDLATGEEDGKCAGVAAGKASPGGMADSGERLWDGGTMPDCVVPLPPLHASPHGSGLSSEHSPLPELVQHVEAHDAAAAHSLDPGAQASEHVLVSATTLPPRLREWVVDPSAVEYLRWPNGSPIELGRGASARVFKAVLNGRWQGQDGSVGQGTCCFLRGVLLACLPDWLSRTTPVVLGRHCSPAPLACPHHPFGTGETVAAKEVDIGQSPVLQEAFVTECLRLQQLRHPNIVQLMGVAVSGAKGIVLLEYAEGEPRAEGSACSCSAAASLKAQQSPDVARYLCSGISQSQLTFIRRVPAAGRDLRAALDVRAAGTDERLFGWHRRGKRVALQLARALNYLHSKSIVHLDVKSANVLLTGGRRMRGAR